ncbi:hypothetical protein GYMLUDRAFT_50514 [Collybiopsis luxurians FD-317 M1]|uniref:Unplaced genomic scaffold GYMLUscaffold_114, whole genome shotgun sequence n=1 Tax=Collybiopsis luxurians FD-317 M1 TaxID=944289 RepID=A0A0D0C1B0_9AGAR|nr:hypothetical protein GYMLUDRAFT_50514 [Collybiopsis luxurians FD-317 M1]
MSESPAPSPAPAVPPIAPKEQEDGSRIEQPEEVVEQAPITEQEVGEYREQDRFLPIANVSRIMKSSVPPTAKIAKDAKECVQECVSEFISFITSEAAEKCQLEKRKTIGGEDILHAMGSLGFENYVECLKIHLAKLRAHQHGNPAAGSGARGDHLDEE